MPFNPTTNVYTRLSNSFSHPINGTTIDDVDAENYFDDIDTAFNLVFSTLPRNIVDFGADPTGVADSSPAIQAAINSLPPALNINTSDGGGAIFCPRGTYKLLTTITIDRPCTFYGTYATNFTANDASTDLFHITQSFVSFGNFGSMGRPGTPSGSSKAVVVGAPVRTITDGATTNTSDVLTSATANFTSADVNKGIFVTGQGLNAIASIISTTQVHLGAPATATATGITCKYSFTLNDVILDSFYAVNHITGVELNMTQKTVVRNVHALCKFGLTQTAEVWGDVGDNAISDCTFQSYDDATGAAVLINSGGGSKYSNCKILGGLYGMAIIWSATGTSSGPWLSNCSIENATIANLYVYCDTTALYNIKVTGCEFFCSNATNVMFENSPAKAVGASFVGNITQNGGPGNNHYLIRNLDHGIFSDNFAGFNNVGVSITLGANTNNCVVRMCDDMTGSIQYSDSGTNNTLKLVTHEVCIGGKLLGANFNTTGDQTIVIKSPTTNYQVESIVVKNASVSMTTAAGGFYTGAAKTGVTVIPAATTYASITATAVNTAANSKRVAATDNWLNVTTLYFSLTTAQGVAATADIYVYIRPLP